MIESGSSSRGSRRTILDPGLIESWSMSSCETSNVMGMGKRVPSASRSEETTLEWRLDYMCIEYNPGFVLFVISLVHETFQRTETSISNEFEITELSLEDPHIWSQIGVIEANKASSGVRTSVRMISGKVLASALRESRNGSSRATRSYRKHQNKTMWISYCVLDPSGSSFTAIHTFKIPPCGALAILTASKVQIR